MALATCLEVGAELATIAMACQHMLALPCVILSLYAQHGSGSAFCNEPEAEHANRGTRCMTAQSCWLV